MKQVVLAGIVLMALGVMIGAFGAHALKPHLMSDPALWAAFHTGVEYHFYHALGLLAIGITGHQLSLMALRGPAILLFMGVIVFSGSLYLMSVTGMRWLGMVTPLGGTAFITGWVWAGWVVWRGWGESR